ncbi:MAG: response regulator [Candidatus Methylomirabilia bacterium]
MLADDSVTIRKVVELTFSDEDFAVDSVGDGAQAFERARARRPDVIISDVIMPGLNGYELCQRCKNDPDLRSVPFLFLKGTFESFDEDKARSCGADGFIVKPFESQEMIAKVKDLIAKAAAAPAPAPAPARALARAPVAAAPAPIPAEIRPIAPRPVVQQRPLPSPPPIPAIQSRPAPAPAIPAMPARPAPPIPQWPTRPAPVAPVAAPPPAPAPPVYQAPPPTPPVYQPPPQPAPPVYQPPPPPAPVAMVPPAGKTPSDEFGFDFGDAEDDRFGAPAAQPSVQTGAAPPQETSDESDEDLWSEVSLRGGTSDLLDDRGHPGSGVGSDAGILELSEEAALHAPEVLFEDETVFEEVTTARMMPLAPVAEPPERLEEAPVTPALPAAAPEPSAPVAIDQSEIERIVASGVEAAVRRILEPIVGDLARGMIESVAWEVIPDLAEVMIRNEIERVRQSTRTD